MEMKMGMELKEGMPAAGGRGISALGNAFVEWAIVASGADGECG